MVTITLSDEYAASDAYLEQYTETAKKQEEILKNFAEALAKVDDEDEALMLATKLYRETKRFQDAVSELVGCRIND
jgi:hypothetical protein